MGMQDYLRTQPGYEGFTEMLPGYSGMVWTGSSPVIDFGGYTSGGIPIYSTTPFNNYIENVPSSVFHPAGSDGFLDNTIGSALSKVDKQVTTTVGSINETIGPYIPAVGLTAGALIASAATEGLAAPYFAAALGPVWGGVATGAAAGAAGGAVSGLPSTHDGDWSGVAKGAIGGGLLGGAGAGVSGYMGSSYAPVDVSEFGAGGQGFYDQNAILYGNYGGANGGEAYDFGDSSINPYTNKVALKYGSPEYLDAAAQLNMSPQYTMGDVLESTAGDKLKSFLIKQGIGLGTGLLSPKVSPYVPSTAHGYTPKDYMQITNNNWTIPEVEQAQQAMAQAQISPGTTGALSEADPNKGRFEYLRDYIKDISGKPNYLTDYLV